MKSNRLTLLRTSAQRLILLVVLASLLLACGVADPSLQPPSVDDNTVGAEPTGKILFVSDGQVAVWEDGDVRRLTEDANAASPTWAPDGRRFAYVEMSDGFSELIVSDVDGDNTRQLTANEPDVEPYSEDFAYLAAWALDPEWSSAGNQIIYASDNGGFDAFADPVYLWYIEDVNNVLIPPYVLEAAAGLDRFQENPTLSDDGDKAAFVTRTDESNTLRNTEIWTLDLNTGENATLVSHPDGAYDPAWSPVTDDVAYIQRNGTNNDVWVAPVEEKGDGIPYQITNLGDCVAPTWSPDGRFISFFRQEGSGFEAWYVEVTSDAFGKFSASAPARLFEADGIDAPSGMSWIAD